MDKNKILKDVEQKMKLSDFDVTGKKGHAAGGIAGQLHLNEGGRARFANGSSYEIPSRYLDPYRGTWSYMDQYAPVGAQREFDKFSTLSGQLDDLQYIFGSMDPFREATESLYMPWDARYGPRLDRTKLDQMEALVNKYKDVDIFSQMDPETKYGYSMTSGQYATNEEKAKMLEEYRSTKDFSRPWEKDYQQLFRDEIATSPVTQTGGTLQNHP